MKLSEKALEDFHKHIDTLNFNGYHLDAVGLDERYHNWLNEEVLAIQTGFERYIVVNPIDKKYKDDQVKINRWALYVGSDD